MNVVQIGKEAVASFAAGDGTVGATPATLTPGGAVNKHVVVRANAGNTNVIMVGPSCSGRCKWIRTGGRRSDATHLR